MPFPVFVAPESDDWEESSEEISRSFLHSSICGLKIGDNIFFKRIVYRYLDLYYSSLVLIPFF